jgi:hypothetical protein
VAVSGKGQVAFAGRSMERAHRERRRSRDVSVDDRKPDRNVIRALRHLRNSTPASLSASCHDTAISVKGSSRRAVHLSGSLEDPCPAARSSAFGQGRSFNVQR